MYPSVKNARIKFVGHIFRSFKMLIDFLFNIYDLLMHIFYTVFGPLFYAAAEFVAFIFPMWPEVAIYWFSHAVTLATIVLIYQLITKKEKIYKIKGLTVLWGGLLFMGFLTHIFESNSVFNLAMWANALTGILVTVFTLSVIFTNNKKPRHQ